MTNRFFVAHVFFLVAFAALVGAAAVVIQRQRRQWRPMLLAFLPLILIFVTAYLGKNSPASHQAVNIVYDGLLIYNAYYFFKAGQRLTFGFYVAAILATALDFAMHFVIRMM
jgi:uncharacterized membrane protein YozB (DUF420 family)